MKLRRCAIQVYFIVCKVAHDLLKLINWGKIVFSISKNTSIHVNVFWQDLTTRKFHNKLTLSQIAEYTEIWNGTWTESKISFIANNHIYVLLIEKWVRSKRSMIKIKFSLFQLHSFWSGVRLMTFLLFWLRNCTC